MDAVKFIREHERMCKAQSSCEHCPANGNCIKQSFFPRCPSNIRSEVKLVERWAAEHRQETRLSKLLRQYPKAKAECIKEYYSCPAYLGYSCPSPKVRCKDCWDTPIEEEEQE